MLGDIYYVLKILLITLLLVFALQFKVNGVTLEDRTYNVVVKSGFAHDVRLGMQRGMAFLSDRFGNASGELKQKSEKLSGSARRHLDESVDPNSID